MAVGGLEAFTGFIPYFNGVAHGLAGDRSGAVHRLVTDAVFMGAGYLFSKGIRYAWKAFSGAEGIGGRALEGELLAPPFNPLGRAAGKNCVKCVIAFFQSVKGKSLVTAAAGVAEKRGIPAANARIAAALDGVVGDMQQGTLLSRHPQQYFIVYPGVNPNTAEHVMVGIKNGPKTLLYDPQTGASVFGVGTAERPGAFIAYPIRF